MSWKDTPCRHCGTKDLSVHPWWCPNRPSKGAAILAAALALAGCANGPPPLTGSYAKGHTTSGMDADAAQCRNQARLIVGANARAAYWPSYTDCMLGKGYEVNRGQNYER